LENTPREISLTKRDEAVRLVTGLTDLETLFSASHEIQSGYRVAQFASGVGKTPSSYLETYTHKALQIY